MQSRVSELEAVERRMGRVSVLVLDEVESLQAQLRSETLRAEHASSEAAQVNLGRYIFNIYMYTLV